MITDFTGANPIFIDNKRHLGLGFWTEPNQATMLMKKRAQFMESHYVIENTKGYQLSGTGGR